MSHDADSQDLNPGGSRQIHGYFAKRLKGARKELYMDARSEKIDAEKSIREAYACSVVWVDTFYQLITSAKKLTDLNPAVLRAFSSAQTEMRHCAKLMLEYERELLLRSTEEIERTKPVVVNFTRRPDSSATSIAG